ncbi:hypothetical protein KK083_20020 [Fulvivirgaceae bacterium PWU4]|uniref:YD repeat-containing protein n=1 Tax=Chryseosolibacter histidini TaxID=2782349 RepID=A0AAP2DRS1_9BACT|nr:RHS repeat domain-containing protein [Chryseosolibacter histidini]MBT1699194.1 hypothetical protein [Chryseosolibacter histidini]
MTHVFKGKGPWIVLITFFVLDWGTALAQLGVKPVNTASDNIIPPSPEAAALARYAAVPVGLYTGTPQVSIPLWELKEGDITVPVSLSYHAAGNKVEEIASRTGLGWTLNAGGIVTRTIMGEADEYGYSGFINFSMHHAPMDILAGTAAERFPVLHGLEDCEADAQPDQFSFNFGGYTGKFAFNWNQTLDMAQKIDVSSERRITVRPVGLNTDPMSTSFIQAWEITTDDGMKYLFEAQESVRITSQSGMFYPCRYDRPRVTGWYLTRITSPLGHVVMFEYTPYDLQYMLRSSETASHREGWEPANTDISYETMATSGKYLSRIVTGSGASILLKNSSQPRTDLPGYNTLYSLGEIEVLDRDGKRIRAFANSYTNSTGRLTLESIQELGSAGTLTVKPPHRFVYTGTLPSLGGLPTVKINNQDHWGFANNNTEPTLLPTYRFTRWDGTPVNYAGASREPSGAVGGGILTKIIYPAGGSTTFDYEPHVYSYVGSTRIEKTYETVTKGVSVSHQSTTSSEASVRQFTQKLFTVPQEAIAEAGHKPFTFTFTGSYCSFPPGINEAGLGPSAWIEDLSGNVIRHFSYSSSAQTKSAELSFTDLRPGQQYYLVASTLGNPCTNGGRDGSTASVTWLEKTENVLSNSKIAGGLRISKITDHDGISTANDIVRRFDYTMLDGQEVVSSGVIAAIPQYEFETRVHEGDDNSPVLNPKDYISRISNSVVALGNTQGSHIGYRQVNVFHGINGEGGKTESFFTSFDTSPDNIVTQVPFPPASSYDHSRGLLVKQIDYKYETAGVFKAVRMIENKYDSVPVIKKIPAYKIGLAITGGGPFGEGFIERYAIGGYTYNLAFRPMVSSRETLFDENGHTFVTRKALAFDAARQFVISETERTSEGKSLVTEYRYPWQYTPGAAPFIQQLVQRHILSPVIESVTRETSQDGSQRVVAAKYYQFDTFGNNILPSRQLTFGATSAVTDFRASVSNNGAFDDRYYRETIKYDRYNNAGKPEQVTTPGDVVTAYLWGYDNSLPVAKIFNAAIDRCAYAGFESANKGNWSYIDAPDNYSTDARTGKRSFKGIVSASLQSGSYVVSLWARGSGSIKVNGSWQAVSATWTRYQWTLSGPRELTIEANGNLIDDVRLHPAEAHMKTYTYDASGSMTSATDENHITAFYQYDGLGRLVTVKDEEGNIVKHNQYQYKN